MDTLPESFLWTPVSPIFVKLLGPSGAIWLGRALVCQDWARKHQDSEWWWCSMEEFLEKTGLSNFQQRTAREKLVELKILEESRGRLGRGAEAASMWYRLDLELLDQMSRNFTFECQETSPLNVKKLNIPYTVPTSVPTSVPTVDLKINSPASTARAGRDPFGLNIPKLDPDLFSWADRMSRESGLPMIQHRATARAKKIQDALMAIRDGRYLKWAKLHLPWIQNLDLPQVELGPFPTMEATISAILPALHAHKQAMEANSRLQSANLADFLLYRTEDGWNCSPFWRFLHTGFCSDPIGARLAKQRKILAPEVLRLVEGRRKADATPNAPREITVLSRVSAILSWLEERRPALLDSHPEGLRRYLASDSAFLRLVFRWMDEHENAHGGMWLPDAKDPVEWGKFGLWVLQEVKINFAAKARWAPNPDAPIRTVTNRPQWERMGLSPVQIEPSRL